MTDNSSQLGVPTEPDARAIPTVFLCSTCGNYTIDEGGPAAAFFTTDSDAVSVGKMEFNRNCAAPNCGARAAYVGNFVEAVTENGFQIAATDSRMLEAVASWLFQQAQSEAWTTIQIADKLEKVDGRFHELAAWLRANPWAATVGIGIMTSVVAIIIATWHHGSAAPTTQDITVIVNQQISGGGPQGPAVPLASHPPLVDGGPHGEDRSGS